jgi:DNA-binding LacI/PurR family transcriptional regulator
MFNGEHPVPVTIYDVAKQAEVGVGTVSRVLNNNPRVSPETRQRVLDVIDTLNFRPSPLAQRLSRRKTLSIGVIAVFFTRPSVVERLRGVEAVVAASEYDLIVYNIETPAKRDDIFCATAANRRVDGLLVISLTPADIDVERWRSAGIPVVLVDTHHPALPRIVVDDVLGGYRAAQHLLELGHRQIAFVGDPIHTAFNFTSSQDRLAGLQQALAERGIAWRPEYHQTGEHGQEPARALTHQLLALDDPPTAVFAASDTQALGVMQAAREVGIRVPEDLSVIGFDDIEIAGYLNLTTIHQPLFESGYRGINLLLQSMEMVDGAAPREELAVELVIRNTTAPPAHSL